VQYSSYLTDKPLQPGDIITKDDLIASSVEKTCPRKTEKRLIGQCKTKIIL